jgi:hypothetical protein
VSAVWLRETLATDEEPRPAGSVTDDEPRSVD